MATRTQPGVLGRFAISREWLPVFLLFGQSTFLALATGLIFIAGRTLFLVEFGPDGIAYINIAVAFVVSAVFYGMAAALKRWSLPSVAMSMVLGLVAITLLIRLGLSSPDLSWLSFPLLSFAPLFLQVMLVTVGAQAGKILTIQQIKRRLSLIFAGVSAGFGLSGFIVDPFLSWFGATENLLYLCVIALGIAFLLQVETLRHFHSELTRTGAAQSQAPKQETKPLSQILKKRYVILIFTYQMLSALGTQLFDFLFLVEAQHRFPEAEALATFLGNYYVILNTLVILFMFFLAGRLMGRFGMRYGLAANPLGALAIIVVTTIAAIISGVFGPLIVWLATAVSIADILLSNGTTFTAINSTYQALPAVERGPVQAAVEGIGVPVAYGITGLVLVVFQTVPGLELIHVFMFTVLVCIGWSLSAFTMYSEYVHTLVDSIRFRALGEETLSIVDNTSLKVIESFLASDDKTRIMLGLNVLEQSEHERINTYLKQLVTHPQDDIKVVALQYIERLGVADDLPQVKAILDAGGSPEVMAAAIRAYCALEESDAVEAITHHMYDSYSAIRVAAIIGLLRYGGISAIIAAGRRLNGMEESPDFYERALAAQILGEVGDYSFYSPLLDLLDDEDITVRQYAIRAAGEVKHPRLLPQLIRSLGDVNLRPVALTAISAFDEAILPYLESGLSGDYDPQTTQFLIRASRNIDSVKMLDLLKQHLLHPETEIRHQILLVLVAHKFHVQKEALPAIENALTFEANNALRLLIFEQKLSNQAGFEPLQRAIHDEIQQTRKRIFLLLSCVHDPRTMLQAEHLLATADDMQIALAQETLEVSLKGTHQQLALGIINKDIEQLSHFTTTDNLHEINELSTVDVLRQIMEVAQSWTHHWTYSCALYCVAQLETPHLLIDLVEAGLTVSDYRVRETACWVLKQVDPERFAKHQEEMKRDVHPRVAQLATELG